MRTFVGFHLALSSDVPDHRGLQQTGRLDDELSRPLGYGNWLPGVFSQDPDVDLIMSTWHVDAVLKKDKRNPDACLGGGVFDQEFGTDFFTVTRPQ